MASERPSKLERLQALRAEFTAGLPARVASIRAAAEDLEQEPRRVLGPDGTLRRLVHNLAGAGGTFGHQQLGLEARRLEAAIIALGEKEDLATGDFRVIEGHFDALERLIGIAPDEALHERGAPGSPTAAGTHPQGDHPTLIYILDDERLLAEEINQQLQHFGYECRTCYSPDALRDAFDQARPAAVVADIRFSEGPLAGPQVMAELQMASEDPVPTVFISVSVDWQARLAAARAGGRAYLTKPVDMTTLVAELDHLTGRLQESPFRVLLLDDDPLLARHYAAILQNGGMEPLIVQEPARILDRLASFNPDLLLLDLYMPSCSGLEVARVVRQTATYTHLPIVFLSSEHSRDEQLVALKEGGDDFLEKPVRPGHLVNAVAARARRFRALRALMNRDSLTGLLNHTNLKEALEREVSLSHRRRRTLTFAMLDLDHFKSVNDSYGHPVGDRVIKGLSRLLVQRLRKGDVIGRYGGEEFAIILPETDLEHASQVVDELRAEFATLSHQHAQGTFSATFSAGLATLGPDSRMETLLAAADAALYEAKRRGRNQVARAR